MSDQDFSASELIKGLLKSDRRYLAKAITLVESKLPEHRKQAEELVDLILPHVGKSLRIGISGAPGVGKSTFIEALGTYLTEAKNKNLCVLAVDPSSPVTGGSIMGDKTRMEKLVQNPKAFIRPSPSGGTLGGVAQKTRESIMLAEVAGFDTVIVETVGVGQSEVEVANMVDLFIVLLLPSAGDELQGIKKGIIELADMIVINKADGDNLKAAERTQGDYRMALHLLQKPQSDDPAVSVLKCSSISNFLTGAIAAHQDQKKLETVIQVWSEIENILRQRTLAKTKERRALQQIKWFQRLVNDGIEEMISSRAEMLKLRDGLLANVENESLSPLTAARQMMSGLFQAIQKDKK